jgi:NAD(P)-binding Rossmann-like domain
VYLLSPLLAIDRGFSLFQQTLDITFFMKNFLALLLLCSLVLTLSYGQRKVAIVGGGIGGAATAFYLNQFAPGTYVDVYEKEDRVGGRLKHVVFEGEVCEVGGDAWSSV